MKPKGHVGPVRCAIYTRKSTEEGLDQAFNSLDAQARACEATPVASAMKAASARYPLRRWRVLGWQPDPPCPAATTRGHQGRRRRPGGGLQDRPTHPIADGLLETCRGLDQHQTSFVSVTQHFNTTSSMGRLTLNVLLSFAHFEREVTGERIRDKVAASKRKGMWMGGQCHWATRCPTRCWGSPMRKPHWCVASSSGTATWDASRRLSASWIDRHSRAPALATRWNSANHVVFSRRPVRLLNRRLVLGRGPPQGEWFAGQHAAIVPTDLGSRCRRSWNRIARAPARHQCSQRSCWRAWSLMTPGVG